MKFEIDSLKTVATVAALVVGLGSHLASAQTPRLFSKTVTSLITPTTGAPLTLRAGSVVLARLDRDYAIDAAVPGGLIAGVAVLINDNLGSARLAWYDAGKTPVALAAADLDSDGDNDLAVALKGDGGIAVLTNNRYGVFTRTAFLATGAGTTAVAAADLNDDGSPELVVANRGAGTISVLASTGGTLSTLQTIPLPAVVPTGLPSVCSQPNALALVDLNNDGAIDVAVACAGDDSVKILHNVNGNLVLAGTYAAGPCPVAVAAADLNRDRRPDLVVADAECPQVTVLLQDMAGQFTPQDVFLISTPYESSDGVKDLVLVDFNADTHIDILASGYRTHNNGHGQFGTAQYDSAFKGFYGAGKLEGFHGTLLAVAAAGNVNVSYVPPTRSPADINRDWYVNVADLEILVRTWGLVANPSWAYDPDLNDDGYINVGDLQMMVAYWGYVP